MPTPPDMLVPSDRGLYCELGGFHADPWRPVELAVITHAHADHATPGSERYICSAEGADVLARRVQLGAQIEPLAWGEPRQLGDVTISLHPAGHILGSAQIRVEPVGGGPVTVFTGDYKTRPDPTCTPFELVPCDVLLTESTFGLPIYRWPDETEVFDALNAWWRANAEAGRTSVVAAYALGKAQRVLAGLDTSIGPIGVHGAVRTFDGPYRNAGIALPETVHAGATHQESLRGGGLIVAPPAALNTKWVQRFTGPGGLRTAMVSGWMTVRGRRRWRAHDAGFVLSDHADWPGLLETIDRCGARRVGVTHGSAEVLARFLRESRQLDAFVIPTRYTGEGDDAAETDEPNGGDG